MNDFSDFALLENSLSKSLDELEKDFSAFWLLNASKSELLKSLLLELEKAFDSLCWLELDSISLELDWTSLELESNSLELDSSKLELELELELENDSSLLEL